MAGEIDYSQTPLTYRDVESFTQGVEIRDLARRRAVSTLPIIYSGQGDLTIVRQDVGQGAAEDVYTPFHDRRGRVQPQEMLDLGFRAYDEVQSYHTNDLSTMNGVIEPLSIRDALTATQAELPMLRTIKGDVGLLSVNDKGSAIQSDTYEFAPIPTPGNAFYDAQDVLATYPIPGFAGMTGPAPSPFNDYETQSVTSVYYTGRYPKEGGEFGTTRKALGRGHTYDNCMYGTDSIAYGGLKR
jgi:hypothetical protein